jgi:hypothetical protein
MMTAWYTRVQVALRDRRALVGACAGGVLLASLIGFTILPARAASTASPAAMSDEDIIWHNEQAIYAGRAEGSLDFYVDHADKDYAGWPPMASVPMDYDALAASARHAAGKKGEVLTLEKTLIRIHRNGKVALAYYKTHRTRRTGGAPVDEVFEDIHVWVKDPEGWRLMGGMARLVPPDRESLGGPLPAPAVSGAAIRK